MRVVKRNWLQKRKVKRKRKINKFNEYFYNLFIFLNYYLIFI